MNKDFSTLIAFGLWIIYMGGTLALLLWAWSASGFFSNIVFSGSLIAIIFGVIGFVGYVKERANKNL